MFASLAGFELKYFVRQPSFYVTTLIFFTLPLLAMLIEKVQLGGSGNVNLNSPFAITQTLLVMSIVGMFVVANFVGGTATRDLQTGMHSLVLSTPLTRFDYLWARLLGAALVCVLVFLAVPLGSFVGSLSPTLDAARLGALMPSAYLWAMAVFVPQHCN